MSKKLKSNKIVSVLSLLGIVFLFAGIGTIATNDTELDYRTVERGRSFSSYIAKSEEIPDTSQIQEMKDAIEQSYILGQEAILWKNKDKTSGYKEELHKYFSNQVRYPAIPKQDMPSIDGLVEDKGVTESPLYLLSSDASELERQRAFVDEGLYGQELANFEVTDSGVEKFEYKCARLNGDHPSITVDIISWSTSIQTAAGGEDLFYSPKGGMQFTFYFVLEDGRWKITGSNGIIIPGYQP